MMKLIIDPDISPEEFKKIQTFNIKMMDSKIIHKIYEAVQNGTPVSNITNAQIGDAIQAALAAYWEEKSKHLTPPPMPVQCCDCPNKRSATESLISRYEHDSMSGVFMARPTEVVKVGEPLPNSEEITNALEKGEIYKRVFEDGYKHAIDKLKDDIFSKSNNMEDSWDTAGILNLINMNFISFITGGEKE